MKKIVICIGVVILGFLLFYLVSPQNEKTDKVSNLIVEKQKPNKVSTPNDEINVNNDIYKKNMQIVEKYMDTVYNTSSKSKKDYQEELKDIVTENILNQYHSETDSNISDGNYTFETKLKHVIMTANDNTVISIYTLKTITNANENEAEYLLQVSIDDGKINKIVRNDMLN